MWHDQDDGLRVFNASLQHPFHAIFVAGRVGVHLILLAAAGNELAVC